MEKEKAGNLKGLVQKHRITASRGVKFPQKAWVVPYRPGTQVRGEEETGRRGKG